jgi:glutaredoxin-like protein NrdH
VFDSLPFTSVPGREKKPELTVYALSTCGFCKRGIAWLNDHSREYRYVYMDLVPIETKNSVKAALAEKFGKPVSFPYLVIDDSSVLVGFVESDWEKALVRE